MTSRSASQAMRSLVSRKGGRTTSGNGTPAASIAERVEDNSRDLVGCKRR